MKYEVYVRFFLDFLAATRCHALTRVNFRIGIVRCGDTTRLVTEHVAN